MLLLQDVVLHDNHWFYPIKQSRLKWWIFGRACTRFIGQQSRSPLLWLVLVFRSRSSLTLPLFYVERGTCFTLQSNTFPIRWHCSVISNRVAFCHWRQHCLATVGSASSMNFSLFEHVHVSERKCALYHSLSCWSCDDSDMQWFAVIRFIAACNVSRPSMVLCLNEVMKHGRQPWSSTSKQRTVRAFT